MFRRLPRISSWHPEPTYRAHRYCFLQNKLKTLACGRPSQKLIFQLISRTGRCNYFCSSFRHLQHLYALMPVSFSIGVAFGAQPPQISINCLARFASTCPRDNFVTSPMFLTSAWNRTCAPKSKYHMPVLFKFRFINC